MLTTILLAILALLLLLSLLEIRSLRRKLRQASICAVIPALSADFILSGDNKGFYLENISPFLARSILIEDTTAVIDDYGYKKDLRLKFGALPFLKPGEKSPLAFTVFDRGTEILADQKTRILPHLATAALRLNVTFSNVENKTFRASFTLKNERFFPD